MSIFITSDTHLGHSNILKFCSRPFSNVEDHDKELINRWNSKVGKNDTVYHLGDFAFANPLNYINKLNGNIRLIVGNHDDNSLQCHKINRIFQSIDTIYNLKYMNETIVLSHFAMRVWDKSHFNSIHCFGHSHNRLASYGKSFDVGVDTNNYYPYSIDEIITKAKSLPDNDNLVTKRY